ncbi:MAG: cyclopropane-fatty-acyl-phospholipid synthase family protein [Hyphomicrobiaceae bacterium]|nr:cyclopropane-fatty-acyl-phospholipid synthase family protein [Hyphomicrobiaceae bacterium]
MQTDDTLDTDGLIVPSQVHAQCPQAPRSSRFSWREEAIVRAVARLLKPRELNGSLRLDLPSGRCEVFGDMRPGPSAHVVLRSFAPLWHGLSRGSLGLVEAHIDGAIDTPDLGAVLRFCLANRGSYAAIGGGFLRSRLLGRLWHRQRANTLDGSRRNIAAHYDLGNAFYALWLDPTMMYSSAIFDGAADETLHDAQLIRLQRIADALELSPGQSVLEIGCGWGGLAEALAMAGANVDAITISAEQLAFTQARLARAGLTETARARFCDYRHLHGRYDRIVSIEMIEAVGEENWPVYFKTLSDRLAPGGSAILQAITIDEAHFDAYRRDPDFIQRYIFPGGMLPTVKAMATEAARAGLQFETVERFGVGYARTLAHWRDAFDAAWPNIEGLGFDDRFRRMWRYYLTYCEVGFEAADIDVGLYRLRRPG